MNITIYKLETLLSAKRTLIKQKEAINKVPEILKVESNTGLVAVGRAVVVYIISSIIILAFTGNLGDALSYSIAAGTAAFIVIKFFADRVTDEIKELTKTLIYQDRKPEECINEIDAVLEILNAEISHQTSGSEVWSWNQ
ncbi:MAG: hypothetical protein QMD50_02650 [Patescibacteria group bacterium]|nr:hypothetical protein [Patescibacteria group bacterium]